MSKTKCAIDGFPSAVAVARLMRVNVADVRGERRGGTAPKLLERIEEIARRSLRVVFMAQPVNSDIGVLIHIVTPGLFEAGENVGAIVARGRV